MAHHGDFASGHAPAARRIASAASSTEYVADMQLHLSPRHVRLTAAIHRHVAEKIEHLEELSDQIVAAHIVLIHDETAKPADAFTVKIHLAIPGPDITADASAAELYAALDVVLDKIARQLRKRKTKLTDKRRSKLQREREQQRGK